MSGKTLIQVENPVTQSIAAIKALLQWKGRASDPLPQFVELGKDTGKVVLVLSNKKDAFYCTTATKCSCPAATFHQGPCKHQRKFFSVAKVKQSTASEPLIQRGGFRPVDLLPSEERAKGAEA
jgi:folate-dependent phosphoribosylglycinamide formyltransferase PurN